MDFAIAGCITNHRKRQGEAGQSGIALAYPSELYRRECAFTLGHSSHGKTH
jgi:hypothetical protein